MVIARELALRRWRVILLEKSKRLGGKAGAEVKDGRPVEHGYHVFPKWYPNVRAILDRIGVRLIDFDRYHFLQRGEYPRKVTVLAPTGLAQMWHNTFRGMLPWYHNILYNYSVLDMISRPLSEKSYLDRVSQIGLVRGKWYSSESVAEFGQEQVLKASAIPVYDLSAMTAKRVASYWVRQARPFLSVLPGDLQTEFIDPQTRELQALGVDIRYECEVAGVAMRDGRVAAIETRGGTAMSADAYALCTPFEVTRKWLHDDLYERDPDLGNMHLLEAQPMAALHLRIRKQLPDLPREHIFFHASRYALSLIEVGRLWGDADRPHLSFISSNYGPLNEVSEEGARDLLAQRDLRIPADHAGGCRALRDEPERERAAFHQHDRGVAESAAGQHCSSEPLPGGRLREERNRPGLYGRRSLVSAGHGGDDAAGRRRNRALAASGDPTRDVAAVDCSAADRTDPVRGGRERHCVDRGDRSATSYGKVEKLPSTSSGHLREPHF